MLGMWKRAVSASKRAISKRDNVWSMRSPAWARKSMRAVPELSWSSSSKFSNFVLKRNMI
eukprot:792936-Pyramimonas_sp.AAC.1